MPVLFVCEDNGWGISVPSPTGWVERSLAHRPGLRYEAADGTDPVGVFDAAEELADHVRSTQRPAVLHLRTVRFGGHAGTDVESAYRSAAGIRADRANDPLLATARVLVAAGATTPDEVVARYLAGRAGRQAAGDRAADQAPPHRRRRGRRAAGAAPPGGGRRPRHRVGARRGTRRVLRAPAGGRGTAHARRVDQPRPRRPAVRRRAGARVRRGRRRQGWRLRRHAGPAAQGRSPAGVRLAARRAVDPRPRARRRRLRARADPRDPVPRLPPQRRGPAARRGGQPALLLQRAVHEPARRAHRRLRLPAGFGGHFHNDNGVAVLRDIPGLVIASPSHPADAPAMLRSCVAAAVEDGTVSVFLEPIALYHTRDLHDPGDELWTAPYAPPSSWTARAHPDRLAGRGPRGRRRARRDVGQRPLPLRAGGRAVGAGGHRLPRARPALAGAAADRRDRPPRRRPSVACSSSTRRGARGGVGEAIVAGLAEAGFDGVVRRVAGLDSFIPLGDAARLVLVSEDDIEAAIRCARRLTGCRDARRRRRRHRRDAGDGARGPDRAAGPPVRPRAGLGPPPARAGRARRGARPPARRRPPGAGRTASPSRTLAAGGGVALAGPTMAVHGSDELCARLLRRSFTGEDSWCQLFSEPGAGSDMAGLGLPGRPRRRRVDRRRAEGLDDQRPPAATGRC